MVLFVSPASRMLIHVIGTANFAFVVHGVSATLASYKVDVVHIHCFP
jgi:hypothetical protein